MKSMLKKSRFVLTAEQRVRALQYQPFMGDDTQTTVLADSFVVTRKPHTCQMCGGRIPMLHTVRAMRERNDEERIVKTWYWCRPCCAAMASSWIDDGDMLTIRHALLDVRRGAMPRDVLERWKRQYVIDHKAPRAA